MLRPRPASDHHVKSNQTYYYYYYYYYYYNNFTALWILSGTKGHKMVVAVLFPLEPRSAKFPRYPE